MFSPVALYPPLHYQGASACNLRNRTTDATTPDPRMQKAGVIAGPGLLGSSRPRDRDQRLRRESYPSQRTLCVLVHQAPVVPAASAPGAACHSRGELAAPLTGPPSLTPHGLAPLHSSPLRLLDGATTRPLPPRASPPPPGPSLHHASHVAARMTRLAQASQTIQRIQRCSCHALVSHHHVMCRSGWSTRRRHGRSTRRGAASQRSRSGRSG